MNKDCNIARDLMPLVIDSAASDESAAFVEEHVQDCPSCRAYYDGMKKGITATAEEQQRQDEEKKMMAAAALALKKRRRRRALKAVLLGTAVALVLTWCGALLFSYLAYTPAVPLKADQIEFSMYQLSSGDIYFRETALNAGFYVEWQEHTQTVDGKKVLSLQAMEPRLTLRRQETGNSCSGILRNDVDLIRIGREGDWKTVWEKGQEIPAASEALENYWAVSGKIDQLYTQGDSTPDGKPVLSHEQQLEIQKLHAELSYWGRMLYEERQGE